MNSLLLAYPQLGMMQLVFRNMSKELHTDGLSFSSGCDVELKNVSITKNLSPCMIDGDYGIVIPIHTKVDFIHNISLTIQMADGTDVMCIVDHYFYARGYRLNINEYGEDTFIPFLYLRNNNNNLYVILNRAMVEGANATKYTFSYQECLLSRTAKQQMFPALPGDIFDYTKNKYPQITPCN